MGRSSFISGKLLEFPNVKVSIPMGFEISGIGGSDAGSVDLNFVSVVFP